WCAKAITFAGDRRPLLGKDALEIHDPARRSLEPRPNGGERIRAPLNFEADCPAQHDVAAQVLANGRFSGANILRDRFEIFSQLFRIRPRNRAPLSSQRVHGEVCAVRAEAGLGPSVIAVVQLAAAEQVRQLKLLRDRRAESIPGETPNLERRRLADVTIDLDPRL